LPAASHLENNPYQTEKIKKWNQLNIKLRVQTVVVTSLMLLITKVTLSIALMVVAQLCCYHHHNGNLKNHHHNGNLKITINQLSQKKMRKNLIGRWGSKFSLQ